MKYWDCLGEYDAESASWSALAGGGGSSPYFPLAEGRLIGLRTVVSRDAATTLTDHVQLKLQCANWPVNVIVGAQGSGLQTVPALMSGEAAKLDWDLDLPIAPGKQITIEGRDISADTYVGNSVFLYGLFETGG